jgi:acyl carrier protein
MSIEERVNRVLVDGIGLKPGELVPEAKMKEDLGIDSTEMVEVMVALEKEFGLKIPDGVIGGETKLKDLVNYFCGTLQ